MVPKPTLDASKGTVLLPLAGADFFAPSVVAYAAKEGFRQKDETHLTVIGFQTGAKIVEASKSQPDVFARIQGLLDSFVWEVSPSGGFYRVSKKYEYKDAQGNPGQETRESIVRRAECPSLDAFYEKLGDILGERLDAAFPHVTLYTKGTDPERSKMGIGINSMKEWNALAPVSLDDRMSPKPISKILVPSRPQPDTIVSVFILKNFGRELYPGIESATFEIFSQMPEGETASSLVSKGSLPLDIGGGDLDHHKKEPPVTCSELVATKLGVKDDPALAKLLEYARRDDIVGKGTVSSDALDRAFGLSGLVAAMNKTRPDDAAGIVRDVLPLIQAHYAEEVKRTKELPLELENLTKAGKVDVAEIKQRDKKFKVIFLESDNMSMPGYLRSVMGGRHDVVVQRLASGHTNILTRPTKRVDLRSLALVIRLEEANQSGISLDKDARYLSQVGRIAEIPNWYYDDATNSIQNGGANPKDTAPTKIDPFIFKRLVEAGLSEAVWSPLGR